MLNENANIQQGGTAAAAGGRGPETLTSPYHLYRLFGLTVASELPLPELRPCAGDAPPDVTVRLGAVPETQAPGFATAGGGAVLWVEGTGRYFMRDGAEMVVQPEPGVADRNLRIYLLGSAMGAILHQRGLLPLHANAVVVDGRAIAFSGRSGSGKSTLAAWFHDRGFEVLADDVCVVTMEADGPVAQPGVPRLRLWREALGASGRTAEDYELSFEGRDKYDVPTAASAEPEAVPLGAVYMLEPAVGADATVERLAGSAAAAALIANTYRRAWLETLGRTAPHFLACTALAARVPVFRAGRDWGFDRFDAEAERLLAHARAAVRAMD